MTFDELRVLIEARRCEELAEELRDVDPVRRKELAAELTAYERRERVDWGTWNRMDALAIAGACLLPNPSTLAPWLVRNSVGPQEIPRLLEVLRRRNVPWLHDLGRRIAARLSVRVLNPWLFQVADELCGDEPPDTDGFLLHLADSGPRVVQPRHVAVLPRMLGVGGVGRRLSWHATWPPLLLATVPREVLLDRCLTRLHQGGASSEMAGFLALHNAIDPSLDEITLHAKDYVALLPGSRGTVATMAQAQLKKLDELDFALLCDASRWVFARTEKKLVRTQLTWLGRHAADRPDEVLPIVEDLLTHESSDLRERAEALLRKHGRSVAEPEREPEVELAPFVDEPMPSPLATPGELCRELLAMFATTMRDTGPVAVERVLEALVRFAWQDRESLRTALQPALTKYPWLTGMRQYRNQSMPLAEFCAVVRAAVSPVQRPGVVRRFREWLGKQAVPFSRSPHALMVARLAEIAAGLEFSPQPALVSTPMHTSGLLAPDVLADRLARADAEGWQPWPEDLFLARSRGVAPNDPVVAEVECFHTPTAHYGPQPKTERRLLVTVTPGLPGPEKHWHGYDSWSSMVECWPSLMPAQRDVAAAFLVPHFAHRTGSGGPSGPLLPMLARADGPVGVGMTFALAYGLGAEQPLDRAHAVDAVLVLAARSQFDGAALGGVLGRLLERGDVVLGRVVPALRDVARSGASQQVWDVVRTSLPRVWTHNRVADLLDLAVLVARRGEPVDGLAEVAARKSSSRTVKEAKRLVAALNG